MATRFLNNPNAINMMVGILKSSTIDSHALDSAYTFETENDAWFTRFVSPVTQSSGALTLYVYCTATNGTPTDVRLEVRNGPGAGHDKDTPEEGGSALATSGAVDFSSADNTWVALSVSGLSLTAGQTYYLVVYNATSTQTSNYPTIAYRALPINASTTTIPGACYAALSGYVADGFLGGAPTGVSTTGMCCAIKFDDGTLLGNTYVASASAASDNNDRGNRFQFDEDVKVGGVIWFGGSSAIQYVSIYTAAGVAVLNNQPCDTYVSELAQCVLFPPVTLTGGTAYDVVLKVSGATSVGTVLNMGEAEGSLPADVLACRLNGVGSFVTGSTPGDYTEDTSKQMLLGLLIDSIPAIEGGSGGPVINYGMNGGLL